MNHLETAYHVLYLGSILILALLICLCLIRAIIGPKIADRIVAINMVGTMTIVTLAILSAFLDASYLVDVCLIYAMISFLSVIVLTKVYLGVHNEQQQKKGGAIHD